MSSGNPGGSPNLGLTKKPGQDPTYPANAIESKKQADFNGAQPSRPVVIKLGIRVKKRSAADFQTPTLVLTTRSTPAHPGISIPLTPLPDYDPVVADLETGLGCDANEKWFAYTLRWDPSLGVKFDSVLTVTPFPYSPFVTDNGFEIVTVAFCHASQQFTNGVYTYAVSVLPGRNTQARQVNLSAPSTGPQATKKTTKTGKGRTPPRAKGRRKKKPRR